MKKGRDRAGKNSKKTPVSPPGLKKRSSKGEAILS